ncbi:MAG: hypothetical protein DLM57_14810 [Pseudonocardiales bacterium]|nr:MAG: hypothetical protein DLM57_14810 [Pseudonocardiales bacterium]
MSSQPPERYARDESEAHRLDRNYSELLQELRVAQTGVQVLFAFLLSIAFQQRFDSITWIQRDVYIATLVCAAIAAALFIAPVAVHRVLFGLHRKDELVAFTGRMAVTGLVFLALAMLGALLLVVDLVVGPIAAAIATSGTGVLFVFLWYVLPMRTRERTRRR